MQRRGLGLALVRQAVHRAHGTVELTQTQEPPGGAEFVVRLPLGTRLAGAGTSAADGSPSDGSRSDASSAGTPSAEVSS